MISTTIITKILNLSLLIALILLAIDSLSLLEIKTQIIKSFVFYGFLIFPPLLIVWNYLFLKSKHQKKISTIILSGIIVITMLIGPLDIIFASKAWKTQTILYQSKNSKSEKIEFQIQDVGALGYNKRTVQVNTFLNIL